MGQKALAARSGCVFLRVPPVNSSFDASIISGRHLSCLKLTNPGERKRNEEGIFNGRN